MTDMITVSRKEIEALIVPMYSTVHPEFVNDYVCPHSLRALLDKAEVSEPVGEIKISWGSDTGYEYGLTLIGGALGSQKEYDEWIVKNFNGEGVFKLYTSPRDQSAKIAELESEIARLKAIT